jgi:hypothetical protein
MFLTIHLGAHEIGGARIELRAGATRIIQKAPGWFWSHSRRCTWIGS